MKIAIVHYWLLGMRGGERVVEALCRLFPDADIFTLFYEPDRVSPAIRSHQITPSFLNPLRRHYRSLLPLMPMAVEHFDLRDYDLVISSESGPAKGVITSSRTRHVCYCHSPMRYLWDLYSSYVREWTSSSIRRTLMVPLTNYLRLWDYATAARVDEFCANSVNVRNRIWRTYRRDSTVIYPPVAVETFYNRPEEDYYLITSELVAYKRIDDAVRCFSTNGRKLKIVGDGPEFKRLRAMAGRPIEFTGRVSEEGLRQLYASCRAVVMPGEEDFGMVPVEAMASGKPVIALKRGGVLESVPQDIPGAGVFYDHPGPESLQTAVWRFESMEPASPCDLQASVERFSEQRFAEEMQSFLFGHRNTGGGRAVETILHASA
jgi:glycosyltransferase involved in cell wall biosynthesis